MGKPSVWKIGKLGLVSVGKGAWVQHFRYSKYNAQQLWQSLLKPTKGSWVALDFQ